MDELSQRHSSSDESILLDMRSGHESVSISSSFVPSPELTPVRSPDSWLKILLLNLVAARTLAFDRSLVSSRADVFELDSSPDVKKHPVYTVGILITSGGSRRLSRASLTVLSRVRAVAGFHPSNLMLSPLYCLSFSALTQSLILLASITSTKNMYSPMLFLFIARLTSASEISLSFLIFGQRVGLTSTGAGRKYGPT